MHLQLKLQSLMELAYQRLGRLSLAKRQQKWPVSLAGVLGWLCSVWAIGLTRSCMYSASRRHASEYVFTYCHEKVYHELTDESATLSACSQLPSILH